MNLIEQNDSRESKKITRGKKKNLLPRIELNSLHSEWFLDEFDRSWRRNSCGKRSLHPPKENRAKKKSKKKEGGTKPSVSERETSTCARFTNGRITRERKFAGGNFEGIFVARPDWTLDGEEKRRGGFNKGGTRKVTFLYRYRTFEIVHALGRGVMSF